MHALSQYIESCRDLSKKGQAPLPNVCGFCRYVGIGRDELMEHLKDKESVSDRILTVLEDEAFNSGASATVLSQYLKVLDGMRTEEENNGRLTVIFEHGDGEERIESNGKDRIGNGKA